MSLRYRRGDVWLYDPPAVVGSEIDKSRPAAIISPDEMNEQLRTVMIVPFTTRAVARPYRVSIDFAERSGFALVDQTRSVSLGRLVRPLGRLPASALAEILATLRETFAL
ncbi:MAG: type II toxin-antitoxin system PemK/MazF family toxin [Vulcanimicrobiaceae bacterium]